MTRSALVTGAAGQDGSYLIDLLLSKNYHVHAQSRHDRSALPQKPHLQWHLGNLTDERFLADLLTTTAPDEIYNLAAVTRPGLSWEIPHETTLLNAMAPLRICEFLAQANSKTRLFQASSSEMFGDMSDDIQSETTSLRPQSPYGISKAFAHQTIGAYRQRYGMHASSGILFNHESPLRPLGFVSQKIAHAAAAISLGMKQTRELDERGQPIVSDGKVTLGNIDIRRDFGFAGDVANAMHMMLQNETPDDYIIGTGESHSIAQFCDAAFRHVGLDWQAHVAVDAALVRSADMRVTTADSRKLRTQLGWKPALGFADVVRLMVDSRLAALKSASV